MLRVWRLLPDLRQHSQEVLTFKPAPVKSGNEFLCGVLKSGISGPSIKNTSVSCSPNVPGKGANRAGCAEEWEARWSISGGAAVPFPSPPETCRALGECGRQGLAGGHFLRQQQEDGGLGSEHLPCHPLTRGWWPAPITSPPPSFENGLKLGD